MGKIADRYFHCDPWRIVERGFDPAHGRVAESVFALANEYMGVRGYFDEGYSGDRLQGTYVNGVFERTVSPTPQYRGVSSVNTFMANTFDWLYTRILLDGETLDLAVSTFFDYERSLDMRTGLLDRRFTWRTQTGKLLRVIYQRLVSMTDPQLAGQRLILEAINFTGNVFVTRAVDISVQHESMRAAVFTCLRSERDQSHGTVLGRTSASAQHLCVGFVLQPPLDAEILDSQALCGIQGPVHVSAGIPLTLDRLVAVHAERNPNVLAATVWEDGCSLAQPLSVQSFDTLVRKNAGYWNQQWQRMAVEIEGDLDNLQGIRYCLFQLHQTYHGTDPSLNIGAKGLTGEAYNGHAFWDSEAYCLPFFLFTNPEAARNLLEFRYKTLPQARLRAAMLDCKGACYPIATLDGNESCALWQHASLQFQPTTAVAYGIQHYVTVTDDQAYLFGHGLEMLVEICRFLASRGQWGARTGEFGYFCVMGPDEFQMMVNNNAYTNYMAKQAFDYTLSALSALREADISRHSELLDALAVHTDELDAWQSMSRHMRIPFDRGTGVYEQHDGFFDLPHLEIDEIPVSEFPLYAHWSYDRIYRNDMIKQPDVLMFMFLHNRQFSLQCKRVNYGTCSKLWG